MYDEINLDAKNYLMKELDILFYKKYDDENLLKRCYKELDLLFENDVLFIIEYLYKFKRDNKKVKYYFEGMINNLLVLYVLDLSVVDPLKYNLSYELYFKEELKVSLTNYEKDSFINYLSKIDDFKIILGKNRINNSDSENEYLLLPIGYLDENMLLKYNLDEILETVNDYREYSLKYLTITIKDKHFLISDNGIDIKNVLNEDFEIERANILKPQTFDDYVKVKSISHSVKYWKNNQDILVQKNKINIKSLISSIDDIFDYLLKHSIDRQMSIDIAKFIYQYKDYSSYIWHKYIDIMKKHNCDDMFINIIEKSMCIHGRGDGVSECLFVLDKDNYVEID